MQQKSRPLQDEPRWHCLDTESAFERATSSPGGLSTAEAAERLAEYGPNAITEQTGRPLWRMFVDQFAELMIIVLVIAAVIAGLVGEPRDSIVILVIVFLNAIFGAIQEYRAERAVAALREMAAPEATVLRDGSARSVPSDELVPGDVVILEAGAAIPADLRLFEGSELQTDEAALTGESLPVEKSDAALRDESLSPGDKTNMAFKGTLVTHGHGRGLVVATGMKTELGRIAGLLSGAKQSATPLQQRLAVFSKRLAAAILVICSFIFVMGLLRGEPAALMFLTAVSLAVAAIPEALPAVITVALGLGAAKMSRRNVLMRRLPAVETLGSVTYICADKTGTLTRNAMRVELFIVDGDTVNSLRNADTDAGQMLGRALALSNDVRKAGRGEPVGDPTEVALFEAAEAAGFARAGLESELPRVAELPFDSTRKRMSTLHRDGEQVLMFSKGAPEHLLPLCSDRYGGGVLDPDTELQKAHELADKGYRVLAVACRELEQVPSLLDGEIERNLSLLALVALIDPPRQGVEKAVADCKTAGIVPVMITGDHPGTARAIAMRLGICGDDDDVLTGEDLNILSPEELAGKVERVRVYARVSPEQKIRIVEALIERGQFAAMTGDGVNDAPALKAADIGVAMGQKGTDVAREAADMVLLDDNFTTIVTAVREGRRIYDNIRKFIKDTMSSNSGEIWTLLIAPMLGLPLPLLPIHILWINLVTDGLPGLAFTAEPEEPNIMRRPPRPPNETIFAHGMWQHILWYGLFVAAVTVAAQAWAWSRGVEHWQTITFTVLTVSQLFHSLAIRSERESLFTIGVFSNPAMVGAVLLTVGLQLLVIYVPLFNRIFHTQPLPLADLGLCFALSALTLAAVEAEKFMVRRGWIYRSAKEADQQIKPARA